MNLQKQPLKRKNMDDDCPEFQKKRKITQPKPKLFYNPFNMKFKRHRYFSPSKIYTYLKQHNKLKEALISANDQAEFDNLVNSLPSRKRGPKGMIFLTYSQFRD
jgi:hypothetical protein